MNLRLITLLFVCVFCFNSIFSQQLVFKEVKPQTPELHNIARLAGCRDGAVLDGDFNHDGFPDLILGNCENTRQGLLIYLSDSKGNYREPYKLSTAGVSGHSLDTGDIDNDGDLDLVVCNKYKPDFGQNNHTYVFLNDGQGAFTGVPHSFIDVMGGSLLLTDLNGDSAVDVIIDGFITQHDRQTKVYINIGSGLFSDNNDSVLNAEGHSRILHFDFDMDGDQDVLVSRRFGASELFENDGSANFSSVTSFPGFHPDAKIFFEDLSGDSVPELTFAGFESVIDSVVVRCYTYIGGDSFTSYQPPALNNWNMRAFELSDLNGNGLKDVLFAGVDTSGTYFTGVFWNDRNYHFSFDSNLPVPYSFMSTFHQLDYNQDGKGDFIFNTNESIRQPATVLFLNQGDSSFNAVTSSNLKSMKASEVDFIDVDGNGIAELFMGGFDRTNERINSFYSYRSSSYNPDSVYTFFDTGCIELRFADFDQDGDLDMLHHGLDAFNNIGVYTFFENRNGQYFFKDNTQISSLKSGVMECVDVNHDGKVDIYVSGYDSFYTTKLNSYLYINQGGWSFSRTQSSIRGLRESSIEFGDLDGDSFPDAVLIGREIAFTYHTEIYWNDGNGGFVLDTVNTLQALSNFGRPDAGVKLFDYDRDGDLDILTMGKLKSFSWPIPDYCGLYTNQGSRSFSPNNSHGIQAQVSQEILIADLDFDQDLDLIISSHQPENFSAQTKVYLNSGNGSFSNYTYSFPYNGAFNGDILTFDSVSHLLVLTGQDQYENMRSHTYKVLNCFPLESTDTVTACPGYTWIDGKTYYSSDTVASTVLESASGCDSLVHMYLTILPASRQTIAVTSCDSFEWINGITYYSDTIGATHSYLNQYGCDSILELNLTIQKSDHWIDTVSTCNSFTWIDGNTYDQDTVGAVWRLKGQHGCDSIVLLNLTLNQSIVMTDTLIVCDSFIDRSGVVHYSTTDLIDSLHASSGCDSIIALHVEIPDLNGTVEMFGATRQVSILAEHYTWLYCDSNFAIAPLPDARAVQVQNRAVRYAAEVKVGQCIDTTSCSSTNTSIYDLEDRSIKIYPNPVDQFLHIDGISADEGSQVTFYNLQGVQVQVSQVNGQNHWDMSTITPGIYLVRILTPGQMETRKVKVIK